MRTAHNWKLSRDDMFLSIGNRHRKRSSKKKKASWNLHFRMYIFKYFILQLIKNVIFTIWLIWSDSHNGQNTLNVSKFMVCLSTISSSFFFLIASKQEIITSWPNYLYLHWRFHSKGRYIYQASAYRCNQKPLNYYSLSMRFFFSFFFLLYEESKSQNIYEWRRLSMVHIAKIHDVKKL